MIWENRVAPVLLMLALLSGSAAAEEAAAPAAAGEPVASAAVAAAPIAAAPLPADVNGEGLVCGSPAPLAESEAAAAGADAAEAPQIAVAASACEAAPAPMAVLAGHDEASLAAAHAELEAKIADLVARDLLAADGAAELRDLLASLQEKLSAAQHQMHGAWLGLDQFHADADIPPCVLEGHLLDGTAAGSFEWRAAPLALELKELEGLHELCPLSGESGDAIFMPLNPLNAEDKRQLEIELENGQLQVGGTGLNAEQLAQIEAELADLHSGESRELVIGLDEETLAQLRNELDAAHLDGLAMSELNAELARTELSDLAGLEIELQDLHGALAHELSPEQLAEIQSSVDGAAHQLLVLPGAHAGMMLDGAGAELRELLMKAQLLAADDADFSARLSALLNELLSKSDCEE